MLLQNAFRGSFIVYEINTVPCTSLLLLFMCFKILFSNIYIMNIMQKF